LILILYTVHFILTIYNKQQEVLFCYN